MNVNLTVLAGDVSREAYWVKELSDALRAHVGVQVSGFSESRAPGALVFVDAEWPGAEAAIRQLDRRGRAVFAMIKEGAGAPSLLGAGLVDDVLIHPFRPLEAWSKLRQFEQLVMWEEVNRMNASFSELLGKLREDLELAERLQKARLPVRFPDVKGMKVTSRYLAGMRSGGDHFDLAESKAGTQLSLVLSDSSSYGLSSAVLSALMKVAVKLSVEEVRSSLDTVRRIREELVATLGEKDRLSLFYGVLSRKDFKLSYLNLGTSSAFIASKEGEFKQLPAQGGPITRTGEFDPASEGEITLQAEDRLALVSDGYVEAVGGPEEMCRLLTQFRQADPADVLNELVYRVKSKFSEPDDMPEQDCTAVIFDLDARLLRLA